MRLLAFAAAATACLSFAPGAAHAQRSAAGGPGEHAPAGDAAAWAPAPYQLGGSSAIRINVGPVRKAEIREKLMPVAANRMVPHERLRGFELSPGATAPREKLRIRRLPAEISAIAPEYSNYEYFVVDDGLIVIVDPRTYEIVDVIAG